MTISTILNIRSVRFNRRPRLGADVRTASAPTGRTRLVRNFVATGEARCPLAGVWSLLQETDATSRATTDEPGLSWLASGANLLWRALHRNLTLAC
jgi:hypothetical protein